MHSCSCCSTKKYNECCGLYIDSHINPDTPEQLMRSRYTAYTQANIDYISKTMKPPASNNFDAKSAKQWATSVKWLGLDVLHTSFDDTKGFVEFIANFTEHGKKECIHELSEFHKIEGKWYYVDGKYNN